VNSFADKLIGLSIGILIGLGITLAHEDIGRSKCEKDLPRTQQCVQVWMPKSTSQ
jgi:hypothetical protein